METRRYQVFVSSTFLDLQEERAAVVSALLQMEAFPAGMELFPAADDDAWTLIKRVIDSSDYYLLVVGGKYGSVDPETELSYTEMEFDYAVGRGLPVMAFLHANPQEISFGKSEADEARRAKLDAFRKKVETKKHVKYWDGASDLSGKVALSFANFRQSYPAIGWIRGDTETAAETLAELNELRKHVARMEQQQIAARTSPPDGADGLSQGNDSVDFRPKYAVEVLPEGARASEGVRVTGPVRSPITWDELFSLIGPDMLDEASESLLRRRIKDGLEERFASETKATAEKYLAKKRNAQIQGSKLERIELSDSDFGTLIVQLRALGLIAKSERKRGVRDSQTYWTLTPYGDERLTRLRAIRREEAGTPEDELQEEEE